MEHTETNKKTHEHTCMSTIRRRHPASVNYNSIEELTQLHISEEAPITLTELPTI